MKLRVDTYNMPVTLNVTLQTNDYRNVEIYAKHPTYEKTALTSREIRFKGLKKIKLILPFNAEYVYVIARNKATGDERGVKILKIEKEHLETDYSSIVAMKNPLLVDFIRHAIDFSLRANILPNGDYNSKSGKIRIKYQDKLKAKDKDGILREILSPARVDATTGQIEVARDYIKQYTSYGLFAILCHEFSHVYLNKDKRNEAEADKNAYTIYLGMGFPKVDLIVTWAKVFKNANTEGNRERMEKYVNAVERFERK